MLVQSGSLVYKEAESKILLTPWSKFQRETLTMDAAGSDVTLDKGAIRLVEAQQARGVDMLPEKRLDFAADEMRMDLNEKGSFSTSPGRTTPN